MSSALALRLKASLAILFWGASFIATKMALRDAHPATIILGRWVFGAAVLWLALARWRMFRRLGAREMVYLAMLGFIAVPLHQALQAIGLLYTAASSMGWLIALIPVFTAILAWLFLDEPMSARKVSGSILAFGGAVFVVSRGVLSLETLRLPSTFGDMLAVLSALNWAIFQVASKPLLRRLEPTLAMAYVMLGGGIVILPFTIPPALNDLPRLTFDSWLAILFLGIFCSGLGYLIWYDALSKIDASQLSSLSYFQPLITLLIAAMLLGETITPAMGLGGAVILFGVYLINRSATRRTEVAVASE